MEELERLLGLIPEDKKAGATPIIDAIKTKFKTLKDEVTATESKNLDIIKSRDALKTQLKDIGKKLGIDIDADNVAEAIEAIKSKKGVDKTEELESKLKEIEILEGKLEEANTRAEQAKVEAGKTATKAILERDMAIALGKHKAVPELSEYIIRDAQSEAVFEDGKMIFKNEDGTTKRQADGTPYTVDSFVKGRRDKEIEAKKGVFFNIEPERSGSRGGGNPVEGDYVP